MIASEMTCTVRSASSPPTINSHSTGFRYVSTSYRHPSCTKTLQFQVWVDGFFKRITLESLGLVINLGHSGHCCPSPTETRRILVVDLSGHHIVCVRFCKCSKNRFLENYRQLLRVGWYPASVHRPQTAFTFDLLDTYHKISLQGKLNLYDFYNAIMQKTDNHGSSKPIVGGSHLVAIDNG